MANETGWIVLSMQDLREVTGYAAESAQEVLEIFERAHPADPRPRDAIDAAWTFARGGKRGKTLRDTAWAAHKAARDADTAALSAQVPRPLPVPWKRDHRHGPRLGSVRTGVNTDRSRIPGAQC